MGCRCTSPHRIRRLARAIVVAVVLVVPLLGGGSGRARADVVIEPGDCQAMPELAAGQSGADVRCLQYALILSGYRLAYSGEFDGDTASAVQRFQIDHGGLVVDGRAGAATLGALGLLPDAGGATPVVCLADAEITLGERGSSVACLQRRLGELGLYRGSIHGLYDAQTEAAVRQFQATHPPLRVDGVVGPKTLLTLAIWSGATATDGRFTGPGPFPASMQAEPFWGLTADGIPFYVGRTPCTASEAAVIAAEFAFDGADVATQQWAVYVASREAGCRFDVVYVNMRTRDDSHCAFQLNALSGTFEADGELGRRGWSPESVRSSLQGCADAASDLWVRCGRGPWIKPYSCVPPWPGAAVGQPPPQLPIPEVPPVPPSSVEPTPVESTPVEPPATGVEPPAAGVESPAVGTLP